MVAWPETRRTVVAGRLALTEVVEDQQTGYDALVFDPTRVTDGITLSDDPILDARRHAYSVSFARRVATRTTCILGRWLGARSSRPTRHRAVRTM